MMHIYSSKLKIFSYLMNTFFSYIRWRIALKTTMREICLSKAILTKVIDHLSSIPVLYSNMSNLIKRINVYCKYSNLSLPLILFV